MRNLLVVKNVKGNFTYQLGDKEIALEELVKIGTLQCREGFNYEIAEVRDVCIKPNGEDMVTTKRIYVNTPFGLIEVKPYHEFYIELPDKPNLHSIAMKWSSYFMEDDDSVHMSMPEHKAFAKDCLEAGITALEVYEYLGI